MKSHAIKNWLLGVIGVAVALSTSQASALDCDLTADPIICSVNAATSWTAPTTREDDSSLPPNEIKGYKLFRTLGAQVGSVPAPKDCVAPMCWAAPANTTSGTQTNITLSADRASVVADGFIDLAFGIAAEDTNGKWSQWSDVTYLRVDFPQEVRSALTPAPKKMQKLNVTISFN